MKIDRRNPRHWVYLLASGCWALLAAAIRPFLQDKKGRPLVLLYGHKLSGNLLALYRHMRADVAGPNVVFLTIDPAYHRQLVEQGHESILAITPGCVLALARTNAIVSDHGLHAFEVLLHASSIKFFDVWHGIPFKGFDADDFRVQHRYDEIWVASPLMKCIYEDRYGFAPAKVVVTGYARTDRLVRECNSDQSPFRRYLGLPDNGKVVLFAPTWQQDDTGRSVFPFGIGPEPFCEMLSTLATRFCATVIFRTHLNSGSIAELVGRYPGLTTLAYADYADTEQVLLIADVLICDWSSIVFDYLLLDRPTVFLDVPPPFRKDFSLGPEYRFGAIAGDMSTLEQLLETAIAEPGQYRAMHQRRHQEVRQQVYGSIADGRAAERCLERLAFSLAREFSR